MQCINPSTPLAAGGARQRRHYKQPVARNDDTANCKSQREGSRQRRKQGARASEQGGNKRDKEDESKATDSSKLQEHGDKSAARRKCAGEKKDS